MRLVLFLALVSMANTLFWSRRKPLVCGVNVPSSEWVKQGPYLRRRGDCQVGYICDGMEIKRIRRPCREPKYFSVHTGKCSFPSIHSHVYSSFKCPEEEANFNFGSLNSNNDNQEQLLKAKRDELCQLITDPDLGLYVEDPDNCRRAFNCFLTEDQNGWMHMCPFGTRFNNRTWQDVDELCVPDEEGCGLF